jgi:aurora kinase
MTPEIVMQKEHNFKVDVWQLGVLLYELIIGTAPFEGGTDTKTMLKRICDIDLRFTYFAQPLALDFITKFPQKDPAKRINLKDVRNHSWIVKQLGPPKCLS